jgi:hypothetical protein
LGEKLIVLLSTKVHGTSGVGHARAAACGQSLSPSASKQAGAINGALFLPEFVDGMPWAHVDIAGTAQGMPPARGGRGEQLGSERGC